MAARILTFAVAVAATCESSLASTFEEYMIRFGRAYDNQSPEYEHRRSLFEHRLELIRAHNSKPYRLWEATTNELTDRTEVELSQLRGWRRAGDANAGESFTALLTQKVQASKALPEIVDWQHLVALSHVPDQGACGSCWAVSAATVLQAHNEIHRADNRTFSAQQLVNCVQNPKKCGGSGGCDGATVELAMEYAVKSGLADAREVPYAGRDQTCASSSALTYLVDRAIGAVTRRFVAGSQTTGADFGLYGYSKLPENMAFPLMQALVAGPVAISVAASGWSMYGSGVFNDCAKDAEIDHAVVLIGYGQAQVSSFGWMLGQADWFRHRGTQESSKYETTKYWTVQNSWGSRWGERGRIRLFRHNTPQADEEYCGIDRDPKVGTACEPYPDSVRVCGMCGILYDSVTPHFAPLRATRKVAQAPSSDAGLRGSRLGTTLPPWGLDVLK